MSNLDYSIKPIGQLRAELEVAAAEWPLAEGTVFEEANCGGVRCEWIRAPRVPGSDRGNDAAIYLHAHGGGYYRGSSRVDAAICSHLCAQTGAHCLSVNYRRPPDEGFFPAALDDLHSVWHWLTSAEGGDISPSQVVVGGSSAGGGLSLALLLKIRDEGGTLPAATVAVSPWTDLTQSGESFATNAAHGPDREYLNHWAGVYLNGADPKDPYSSPLFAQLHGLPPILVQAGGDETMLDDSTAFAAAAAGAGCSVFLEVYAGQPHSFQHEVATKEVAREAVGRMAQFVLRWAGQAAKR